MEMWLHAVVLPQSACTCRLFYHYEQFGEISLNLGNSVSQSSLCLCDSALGRVRDHNVGQCGDYFTRCL